MDVYTEDSNLCLAAVHAGFLVADGGLVTAVPLPGRPAYAGVTRNGISSSNNGAMEGSFSFQPTTVQARYVPCSQSCSRSHWYRSASVRTISWRFAALPRPLAASAGARE